MSRRIVADRIEVSCDGCGRVIHQVPDEDQEPELVEAGMLQQVGELEYCELCLENHTARHQSEQEEKALAVREQELRETIADTDELEEKIKNLRRPE